MNQELINELRSKADIVEVISSYIPLTKKGRNYFGLCPFHDDTNPSMSISSEKQIYKCFVCGNSGNVFNFIMEYEHLSFVEAIRSLAKKYNMEGEFNLKREVSKNEPLFEIMDIACKFFQNNLSSKEGIKAREYLKKRNLDEETIKEFQIGLSLPVRDTLTKLLTGKGHSLEELNLIDLSSTNHDSYINRIIFPLHDLKGRVNGFSGRIYNGEDLNKYQNTKETPIFKKRENLFNYHRVREEVRKNKSVIIMEGFMAVIRAHTVGIRNCIATMGTALSNEQLALIKKLSPNIILCYDGDDAGKKATLSNGEQFLKQGLNTKVISLPEKLDPDDYIIKYGKEKFQDLIDNAINFTDYKIKSLKSNYNLGSVSEKTNYINQVLMELSKEKDVIKREIVLKNLAKETDVWYNTLEKRLLELDTDKVKEVKEEIVTNTKKKKNKYLKAMESIIYYMLNSVEAITVVDNSNIFIPNKNISLLISEIIYYYDKYGNINEADFYSYLEDNKELQNVYKEVLQGEYPSEISVSLVKDNLEVVKNYNVALEIKRLENLIKEENSQDEQIKLMEQIRELKMKEGKSC